MNTRSSFANNGTAPIDNFQLMQMVFNMQAQVTTLQAQVQAIRAERNANNSERQRTPLGAHVRRMCDAERTAQASWTTEQRAQEQTEIDRLAEVRVEDAVLVRMADNMRERASKLCDIKTHDVATLHELLWDAVNILRNRATFPRRHLQEEVLRALFDGLKISFKVLRSADADVTEFFSVLRSRDERPMTDEHMFALFDVFLVTLGYPAFTAPQILTIEGVKDVHDQVTRMITVHGPTGTRFLLQQHCTNALLTSLRACNFLVNDTFGICMLGEQQAEQILAGLRTQLSLIDSTARSTIAIAQAYFRAAQRKQQQQLQQLTRTQTKLQKQGNNLYFARPASGAPPISHVSVISNVAYSPSASVASHVSNGSQAAVAQASHAVAARAANHKAAPAHTHAEPTGTTQVAKPDDKPPPLASLNGVVANVLAHTLIDMGAAAHIITLNFAKTIGALISPTHMKATAVHGTPLAVVGETQIVWSSTSSTYSDSSRVTRLQLDNVLVLDENLGPYDLIIGLRWLWGKRPRRVSYINADQGFYVQFDDYAPLPILLHKADTLAARQKLSDRFRTIQCNALVTILTVATPSPVPLRVGEIKPAITREQMPMPTPGDVTKIEYGNAEVKKLIQHRLETHYPPDFYVAKDSTPRVIPGLVYTPLIRADTNFAATRQKPHRMPQHEIDLNTAEAKRLFAAKVARPASPAPFLAISHAVAKYDDFKNITGARFVGGYHYANQAIIPDAYPLPNVADMLQWAAEAHSLTLIDLRKAFEQIALDERAVPLTTIFMAPHLVIQRLAGVYGFTDLPSYLQRYFDDKLRPHHHFIRANMDNIIVRHMSTEPERIAQEVIVACDLLADIGASLTPEKMKIAVPQSILLGHDVQHNAITPELHRAQRIQDAPLPRNVTELKGFLAALNNYSEHFPATAKLTGPMRALIKGNARGALQWNNTAIDSFKAYKAYVLDHCVLGGRATLCPLPKDLKEITIATDWGRVKDGAPGGVGWIIHAKVDGVLKIICCGSKALPSADIYNREVRGELFALQTALQKHGFFLRNMERVWWQCDCAPAVDAWKKGSSDRAIIQRMLLDLKAEWPQIHAIHVPRAQNPTADYFAYTATLQPELSATVAAIKVIHAHDAKHNRWLVQTDGNAHAQWVNARQARLQAPKLVDDFLARKRSSVSDPQSSSTMLTLTRSQAESKFSLAQNPLQISPNLNVGSHPIQPNTQPAAVSNQVTRSTDIKRFIAQVRQAQSEEEKFAHLLAYARNELSDADFARLTTPQQAQIRSLQPHLTADNILAVKPLTSADPPRIALPAPARPLVVIHDHQFGHFSGNANLAHIERCYWWPGMATDIKEMAMSCRTCQEARQHRRTADIGAPRVAGTPFEQCVIDLQENIFTSATKTGHFLTVADVATRWQFVIPVTSKRAAESAEKFVQATRDFGIFNSAVVDNGKTFLQQFVQAVNAANERDTIFLYTAPYNENARAIGERCHRVNLSVVAKIMQEEPSISLNDLAARTQRAYNERERDDCKLSPFECMFGRPPPMHGIAKWFLRPADYENAARTFYSFPLTASNVLANVGLLQSKVIENNEYRAKLLASRSPVAWLFENGDLVLYKGAPGVDKVQNRSPFVGPFEVTATASNGNILELSREGIVMEPRARSSRCSPYLSPHLTKIARDAGDHANWITHPSTTIPEHWYDPDVLAYHPKHYYAQQRAFQAS